MSDNPDVRQAVVDTAKRMYDIGLVVGTAGNVSGRGADGSIVMTPSSVPYPEIAADNLAVGEPRRRHGCWFGQAIDREGNASSLLQRFFRGWGSGPLSSSARFQCSPWPASRSQSVSKKGLSM